YHIKPKFYYRYLDDIIFVWTGSVTELLDYITFLNNLIPGINTSFEQSDKRINFLDTTIYKELFNDNTVLKTTVFFKETDTHQLLHTTSFHPKHTTKGILKSQLIRFKRICSSKTDYDQTCKTLFSYLKTRGYSFTTMRTEQNNIWYNYNISENIVQAETNSSKDDTRSIIPIIIEHNKIGKTLALNYK